MSAALEQALRALHDARRQLETRPPAFDGQLEAVRQWQSTHVAAYHRSRAQQYNGDALLQFLTRTFYLEADWSELTARPQIVASRIGRIIQDDRPLIIAVRLQATADELDAAVADALVADGGPIGLTPRRYVRAFRAVGRKPERERQVGWMEELVELLAGYADNRAAYWSFRLAATPARAMGMGHTYALLADGFAALRATSDPESAIREAAAAQRALLTRLLRV